MAMQVARILRSRWSPATFSSCRGSNPSISALHNSGIYTLPRNIGHSPCLYRLFMSTTFCRDPQLRSLKYLQPASRIIGKRNQTGTLLGLTVATSFLARWHGAVQCERDERCDRDQQARVTAHSAREEESLVLENRHSQLLDSMKRLWWPTIFVLTVIVGYPYPMSLFLNCILLMWSTKPSPASIYIWVEKRRQRQANEKRTLERMIEKLNASATVMHVEVRDYMLFCLARVTSRTQNSTMVGLLGDWWVVHSSSSTITTLGLEANLDKLAKELISKKAELEAEGRRVAEDGIKKCKSWCEKVL